MLEKAILGTTQTLYSGSGRTNRRLTMTRTCRGRVRGCVFRRAPFGVRDVASITRRRGAIALGSRSSV
eukprot:200048-Pyramimonas_sp.AAC.1